MANFIVVCSRNNLTNVYTPEMINAISDRITPNNIRPKAPLLYIAERHLISIINPNPTVQFKKNALCIGQISDHSEKWCETGTQPPDGTYALARMDEHSLELITDTVATRTIWYLFDENTLIASTSQRAIIMLSKKFALHKKTIAWMVSSGSLGPDNAWDQQIIPMRGGQKLQLDRDNWLLSISTESKPFEQKTKNSPVLTKIELHKKISESLNEIKIDMSKWSLPLSGGVDSRALIYLIPDDQKPDCLTWGLKSSLKDKYGDTQIAKRIADLLKLRHTFYPTDTDVESIDLVLSRFIEAGEGRTDHLSGYMDGMKTWKCLYENDVFGIIRGDEGFGWKSANNSKMVKINLNLLTVNDFRNLRKWNIPGKDLQEIPEYLVRKENESLELWRDRLYHQYRLPIILAALNLIKTHYVEIVNPFLSKRILSQVWAMPDKQRTDKKLFRELVTDLCPSIPFASASATEHKSSILRNLTVREFLIDNLDTLEARNFFSNKLIDYLINNLEQNKKSFTSNKIQRKVKKLTLNFISPELDPNILAFRIYIILYMTKILREDAKIMQY